MSFQILDLAGLVYRIYYNPNNLPLHRALGKVSQDSNRAVFWIIHFTPEIHDSNGSIFLQTKRASSVYKPT